MDGPDPPGDNQTFKVSFTSDGLSALRERVTEKLKEFMGEYTDDTLVEYVVVLLRNGRRKDEARKELNVFLGDDSASFVSWLWDHLSSNIGLYIQEKKSYRAESVNSKPISNELSGTRNLAEPHTINAQSDPGHDRGKLQKISRSFRSRGVREITQDNKEVFPLRSVVSNILHPERAYKADTGLQSHTPRARVQKKRSRVEEHPQMKQRDSSSYPKIDAPRRLLQFAVRDAVKTVQQSNYRDEPASKKLCSVVSTCTRTSLLETRSPKKPGLGVPGALSIALKAVAEAAQDAAKVMSSGSVFDRLGRGRTIEENVDQLTFATTIPALEDNKNDDDRNDSEPVRLDHNFSAQYVNDNMTMLDRSEESSDYDMVNDEYDIVDVDSRQDLDCSQGVSLAKNEKESAMMQYNIAQQSEQISRKTKLPDQELPRKREVLVQEPSTGPLAMISTTRKPTQYQVSRDDAELENILTVEKSKVDVGVQNAMLPKENEVLAAQNTKEIGHAVDQSASSQKQLSALVTGSYSTSRPMEDVDSRTLFVSNVHFAATKDTLSRHFNKFGDVLKVIIITDGATGQPTGSAYVEFLKKESADLALSLNGTSFMSRILKVVRRSSYEAAPMLPWPRIARAPSFASRLCRMPYLRGVLPSTFRAGLQMKPGARSMQWKRETPAVQPNSGARSSLTSVSNVPSPTARSLTYTRPS